MIHESGTQGGVLIISEYSEFRSHVIGMLLLLLRVRILDIIELIAHVTDFGINDEYFVIIVSMINIMND